MNIEEDEYDRKDHVHSDLSALGMYNWRDLPKNRGNLRSFLTDRLTVVVAKKKKLTLEF